MLSFLLAAAAALGSPPLSAVEAGGLNVELREATMQGPCRVNRLMADPTSRRLAIWESQRDLRNPVLTRFPSSVEIVDIPGDDSQTANALRFTSIAAAVVARVEPLRWSAAGDELLLRAGETGAVLLDPANRRLSAAPAFPELFTYLRMETLSHGDTGFYRAPKMRAMVQRIQSEMPPMRWLANVGPKGTAILVFPYDSGLRVTAFDGDRRWDTGVLYSFATSPLLVPGSKRLTFMGSESGSGSFLPYALPLVDRLSGRIVGRFGLDRIERAGKRAVEFTPVFDQILRIEDASANGDTIFALVDLEREKRIVRIRGSEMRSWRLCEKTGLRMGKLSVPHPDSLADGVKVVRSVVRLAGRTSRGEGAFGLLYRPARPDGRLVVVLHGGPTKAVGESTIPREVQDLTPLGITVLMVEQSGMVGGGIGLSERLPRLGMEALRQDMAAVTRWVKRSGYTRAFLLADSFGGASAVVAAGTDDGAFEHIFLRAPLIALPAQPKVRPSLFLQGPKDPKQQQAFEEAVFGNGSTAGRAHFAADLAAATAGLRPSPRLSFYFGNEDPSSMASDLPAAFAGHPSVMVVKSVHEYVSSNSKVEADIAAKLGHTTDGDRPPR